MDTRRHGAGYRRLTVRLVLLAVVVALSLGMPRVARADTHTVGSVSDLQTALYGVSAGDTIVLNPGTYTLSSRLQINTDVTIQSASGNPDDTIVEAAGTSVDGVISIGSISTPGYSVTLRGLTIRNGKNWGPSSSGVGGGVDYRTQSGGNLTIDRCILGNNVARDGGGAICVGTALSYQTPSVVITDTTISNNTTLGESTVQGNGGGGICLAGGTGAINLTVKNSTLSGNTAGNSSLARGGGAILSSSGANNITIVNSTISGNVGGVTTGIGYGGGIYVAGGGTLAIVNATITGNSSPLPTGPDYTIGLGGGIFLGSGTTATIQNTIVSGNAGGDIGGNSWSYTGDHNLINQDITGWLGSLADNGGVTHAHALIDNGSNPALNAGSNEYVTSALFGDPAYDQRGSGYARLRDGAVDIGAYELQYRPTTTTVVGQGATPFGQAVTTTATVTSSSGTPEGTVTFKDGGTTISAPVALLNGSATFTSSAFGIGIHDIAVVYTPDGSGLYSGSSGATTQVIQPATSGVALQSSNLNTTYGDSVTFTATVTGVSYGFATPTGTVAFQDGTTSLGTATLDGSGVATFSTSALVADSHSIRATYTPATSPTDPYFAGSASAVVTQQVAKATPTVTLTRTTGPATSVTGETVGFTAQVTAESGPGPTGGTLTVTISGRPPLTLDLAQGSTLTVSDATLTPSTYTITASYGGDANHSPASATPLSQTVIKADTTTELVTSLNPTVFGQSATCTATVAATAPGAGAPGGTVTFYDGASVLGVPVALNGSGQASLTTSTLAIGTHSLTVVYSGSSDYVGSTALGLTQTVNQANTVVTVTSNHNPSHWSDLVTFTVTASAIAPGAGTPSGQVTLTGDGLSLKADLSNGQAQISTAALNVSVGTSLIVTYGGDTAFNGGSGTVNQVVNQAASSTTVSASPSPSAFGQAVTLIAIVSPVGSATETPAGTVTFYDGADALGSPVSLLGGSASLTTSTLAVGAHNTKAVYSGAAHYAGSTSADVTQSVDKAGTTVSLVSDKNTPTYGDAVTLTATVSAAAPGSGTPTGTVTFYDGAAALGSPVGLAGGSASLTLPSGALSAGSHALSAVYSGDSTFSQPAQPGSLALTVGMAGGTDPSVSPGAPPTTTIVGNTIIVTTTAEASTDSTGKVTVAVSQAQVDEALSKALADASQRGDDSQVRIEIKVVAPANTASVETRIPEAALVHVADGGSTALTVSTPVASITFDSKTLSTISGAASGDVKVTAAKVDAATLPNATQQAIGDRPVFSFSVTSGNDTISQFGGRVTVTVPYTLKPDEDPNAVVIYYIDGEGKLQIVSNCVYDPISGAVVFTTNHFSQYAVGYNKVNFRDVATSAWYANAVDFVAARGIATGSGNGSFSPDSKLTRGQFLVMVMRAYGLTPDENPQDNFSDAGSTYYTGYLAASMRLGISNGVGNNCYAPEREISRQEMCTLLYNTLKLIGQLPQSSGGRNLADFPDAGKIAPWAHDAMTAMVANGTVTGSDGMLMPFGTTSRAQMAQVLYNLLTK